MSFQPVSNQPDFPKMEESVLRFWETHGTFVKSVEQNKDNEEYVFYDGPPFATGLPHYGHLLAGTIKDVIPRYQTMRGKLVNRTFGWDCHGLPVEYEMEKDLNLSGKKEIESYGIGKFNEACRSIVLRYTEEWERIVTRMGRWVDFKNGYRTMDREYMESIWWVFKRLWEMDLIYQGHKILPYCARCSTPLSNFEANQGYADVNDPAITVRFKSRTMVNTYFLAWTTTPWTLPSNMALCVGPEIDYVFVRDGGDTFILAEARLATVFKETPEVIRKCKGAELVGETYEPLFDFFAELVADGAFRVISGDFVSTDDGTGIVHIAPGFGEDDAAVGRDAGLPEVCPVDEECRFTAAIQPWQGMWVKDADKEIIRTLKDNGQLVHRDTVHHSYPHCWRDDSPLIYRAVSTWFVRIDKIKEKMIRANQEINWVPHYLRDGRFGKWLENARDWAISRNRYWGCPLPVWRNTETGETICIGSVEELETLSGHKVPDIHKHFVDDIEIPSQKFPGTTLKRIDEVLDCWFESGAMPYAQQHYPFENKERFESHFPADFIAEGLDQTRGWFYTLVVLGAALFDRPAFRNVVVNGLILAEDGQKMSKRKKNYPDPTLIMDNYGADALRLYLLSSPVVRAEDLKFSEKEGVRETLRAILIPLWHAYSFFVTYANVDGWTPGDTATPPVKPSNPLDRWILSSLSEMVSEIRDQMDAYQLQKAANRFSRFVEDLTNWYIRRSRRRFWKSQNDTDKNEAYQTLHFALITFCQTAAPFIPFVTEEIYRNLRGKSMPESVHLCVFPETDTASRDVDLEDQMTATMLAVKLGRFLRARHEIKTRQPLGSAVVVARDERIRLLLEGTRDIIAEELNVKTVDIHKDESGLVTYAAKADFKVLGKRFGKEMKAAAAQIAEFDSATVADILNGNTVPITFADGSEHHIGESDIVVVRQEKEGICAATEEGVTVALDTRITDELVAEGYAREIVSKIQSMRRDADFEVTDHIEVVITTESQALSAAVSQFQAYICTETLTDKLECVAGKPVEMLDINDECCGIAVVRKV